MHLLIEQITVLPQHKEGERPRWACTNPTEQYAAGVFTWRRINGAWIEGLYSARATASHFNINRVRLVVEGWAGMPRYVEIYDVIGEIDEIDEAQDLADKLAMTEALMGALKRIG